MSLRGNRNTTWSVGITPKDGERFELPIDDGSMDWNIDQFSVAGGSVTTTESLPSLTGAVVDVSQTINGEVFKMGKFVASACPKRMAEATNSTIEFIDQSVMLTRNRLQKDLTLPIATNCIAHAVDLIEGGGVPVTSWEPSIVSLREARTFDRGTPLSDVVQELLTAAGSALRATPDGLRIIKLKAPSTMTKSWWLSEDEQPIHVVDYDYDSDFLAVPNRVTLGNEEIGSVTARSYNHKQWGFKARGYWLDHETTATELVDQNEALEEAYRLLETAMATSETLTIQHGWLPELSAGSVGRLDSTRYPALSGEWIVITQSVGMDPTSLATSTLHRVTKAED